MYSVRLVAPSVWRDEYRCLLILLVTDGTCCKFRTQQRGVARVSRVVRTHACYHSISLSKETENRSYQASAHSSNMKTLEKQTKQPDKLLPGLKMRETPDSDFRLFGEANAFLGKERGLFMNRVQRKYNEVKRSSAGN